MAPKPVPALLRELHGNPTHRRISEDEPQGVGVLWAPPEWFDDEMRAQWHYAIENAPPGLLTATDKGTLAIWCMASVEHARASQEVRKLGQIIKTKDGNAIQNPYLPIVNRQALIMLRSGGEMGFSPSSRAAIGRGLAEGDIPGSGPRQIAGTKLGQYLDEKPDKLS